jgi:hypothetical protein
MGIAVRWAASRRVTGAPRITRSLRIVATRRVSVLFNSGTRALKA